MSAICSKELGLLIRSGWRLIAFETFEEERALRIVEHTADQCQRRMLTWSCASGLDSSGRGCGSLREGLGAFAEVEEPALLVVLDGHRQGKDHQSIRALRDILPRLSQRKQAIIWLGPSSDMPMELARESGHVSLALPNRAELQGLFLRVLNEAGITVSGELIEAAVGAARGLTSGEAIRILRKALLHRGKIDPEAVAEMAGEKRKAIRKIPALTFHDPTDTLDQVGGLGELKHWLTERRKAFGEDAPRFGLPEPRGLLLLGVQGCGKSLCARSVAAQWQFPLVRLDLAAVFSSPEHNPEGAIREATAVAESLAPVVLWIDEIEKGFAATTGDPASARVFGSFLTWMSEKKTPVFVVATANEISALPPELLRRGRFDELFFVDLPDAQERADILAIHLRKRGRDPLQFDIDRLAAESERLSGAELEHAVGAGLFRAFAEARELEDNDLANAIGEVVPLFETYEASIKELRDWSRGRARPASLDRRMAALFD